MHEKIDLFFDDCVQKIIFILLECTCLQVILFCVFVFNIIETTVFDREIEKRFEFVETGKISFVTV